MRTNYPLGPASWPIWLRRLLPYAGRFAMASVAHDFFYERGGTESERLEADWIFLDECLEEVDFDSVTDAYLQTLFAFLYFALVRSFGWAFFRYRETCGKIPKR